MMSIPFALVRESRTKLTKLFQFVKHEHGLGLFVMVNSNIQSGKQFYCCIYKCNDQQLYFNCQDTIGEELNGSK